MDRKLPVIAAFSHAISSTINNLGFAWHVSWPWILVILPINVAVSGYAAINAPTPDQVTAGLIAAQLLVGLFSAFAFASIAVSWHRYILRDEVPHGWARLRADYPVWRYFGNTILIVLMLGLLAIPCGFAIGLFAWILTTTIGQTAAIVLAIVPGYVALALAALAFFYRWSVKLPAIALERQDFSLPDALNATRGNFWQLVGLGLMFFLVAVAIGLVLAGAGYVSGLSGALVLTFVVLAAQVLINWVVTILGVTLLTSLYGYFVERRDF